MKVMRVKSVKEKVTSGEASGQAPWKTEPDLPITKTPVNAVIPEGTVEKGVAGVVNAGKRSATPGTSQAIPVNKFGPDQFLGQKSKTSGGITPAPPHVKPRQLPKNKSDASQESKTPQALQVISNPGERPKLEISSGKRPDPVKASLSANYAVENVLYGNLYAGEVEKFGNKFSVSNPMYAAVAKSFNSGSGYSGAKPGEEIYGTASVTNPGGASNPMYGSKNASDPIYNTVNINSGPKIPVRSKKKPLIPSAKINTRKIEEARKGINNVKNSISKIPLDENGKALNKTKQSYLINLKKTLSKHEETLENEHKQFSGNNLINIKHTNSAYTKKATTNTITNTKIPVNPAVVTVPAATNAPPKTPLELELEKKLAQVQKELEDEKAILAEAAAKKEASQIESNKTQQKVSKLTEKYNKFMANKSRNFSYAQRDLQEYEQLKAAFKSSGGRTEKADKRGMFGKLFKRSAKRKVKQLQEVMEAEGLRYENSIKSLEKEAIKHAEKETAILQAQAERQFKAEDISEYINHIMGEKGLTPNNLTGKEAKGIYKEARKFRHNRRKEISNKAKEQIKQKIKDQSELSPAEIDKLKVERILYGRDYISKKYRGNTDNTEANTGNTGNTIKKPNNSANPNS